MLYFPPGYMANEEGARPPILIGRGRRRRASAHESPCSLSFLGRLGECLGRGRRAFTIVYLPPASTGNRPLPSAKGASDLLHSLIFSPQPLPPHRAVHTLAGPRASSKNAAPPRREHHHPCPAHHNSSQKSCPGDPRLSTLEQVTISTITFQKVLSSPPSTPLSGSNIRAQASSFFQKWPV